MTNMLYRSLNIIQFFFLTAGVVICTGCGYIPGTFERHFNDANSFSCLMGSYHKHDLRLLLIVAGFVIEAGFLAFILVLMIQESARASYKAIIITLMCFSAVSSFLIYGFDDRNVACPFAFRETDKEWLNSWNSLPYFQEEFPEEGKNSTTDHFDFAKKKCAVGKANLPLKGDFQRASVAYFKMFARSSGKHKYWTAEKLSPQLAVIFDASTGTFTSESVLSDEIDIYCIRHSY